jgi:hypothetical protein
MEKFSTVKVIAHTNGLVRVYGDGGMVFEVKGNYIVTETYIDPKPGLTSGEAVTKKQEENNENI